MSTPKDYNEPWMNRKLLKLWKKKHHAWNRYSNEKSQRKWRMYRKEANKLKKIPGRPEDFMREKLRRNLKQIKEHFLGM